MSRYFTLQEAQALLPEIDSRLREALEAKSAAEELDEQLQGVNARITMLGGVEINPAAVAHQKTLKQQQVYRAQSALQEIQKTGCLLKDLDEGLVDFPALLNSREVYLCWKVGESRIGYWHDIDAGFAGRRPISEGFQDEGDEDLRPN